MLRVVLMLCLIVAVPGCAARGVLSILPGVTAPGAVIQPVFIATNRLPSQQAETGLFQQRFGETRDPTLRYARLDVSIPPGHLPGRIEWPGGQLPDPSQHFVVAQEDRLDRGDFLRALQTAGAGQVDVLLFVHGYNVNNAEAAYRLAQIAHDFDADLPVIAYSWPSAGSPRGYVYDRDSVIFSRDGLEELLLALTGPGGRRVLIVAHSMGSQLVMETLRQMAIGGKGTALSRLAGVALISPDIDEDVFLRQAARIQPFPQPFLLMVSSRDRILDVSAFLTGKPSRLGSIENPTRLGDLPVEIIDLSTVEGGDRLGHSTAFTSPAAITLIRDTTR
ncbi:alpha/beta fold hydrolase [Thalassococcus sp. CAU 1522]|uniref:Alpha/beta fold hydrolase n=1 Tax=Thalassococcus arenae TaxID=2851652 RepID=A0ABS6NCA5_9RHOB|nr:alpha/beta fold hydrolase [Thalassococcus arenae]MBV2361307.1 alpha/beta fold hydrolase [Thalassococcus arenae]